MQSPGELQLLGGNNEDFYTTYLQWKRGVLRSEMSPLVVPQKMGERYIKQRHPEF
jgi:hypothetical protein